MYPTRGTGVKLHAIRTGFSPPLPLRSSDTTLIGASLQSTHSNPCGSLSNQCSAASLR